MASVVNNPPESFTLPPEEIILASLNEAQLGNIPYNLPSKISKFFKDKAYSSRDTLSSEVRFQLKLLDKNSNNETASSVNNVLLNIASFNY